MENFLSLLERVDTSWLTLSLPTWATDMIFAFVCGLGLFYLLLPLLPLNSPPPPPGENITAQKVVKRECSKVRKKTRTLRAYRGGRKKPKVDKVLVSLLRSTVGRLADTISFCQLLRQDASGEGFEPEAAHKDHLPPRQQAEESVATNLFLVSSSAPLKEHLLPDSKTLLPVWPNVSASSESQSSVAASQPPETLTPRRRPQSPVAASQPPETLTPRRRPQSLVAASQPPETLTPRRCHSPPWTPSQTSHPPDPVAYPPAMPDPSAVALQCDRKALGTSQITPLPARADESSQHLQCVSSKHPEVIQLQRDPWEDLANCLGRAERELHRSPEGSLGNGLQAVSETEVETCHTRHPRCDSQSVLPVGPGKKELEGTLRNSSNSQWRHTKDSKVPVGICRGIPMKHASVPPENSKETRTTWGKSPLNDATMCKKTCNEISFLDAGTQKVLEKHLTRRLVRHRWSLPLKGLKTVHVFNVNRATALPFPQPSGVSSSPWDSANNCKMASLMEEPFQTAPEEKGMKNTATVESLSTQIPPSALQLQFLRETPPSDNPGPSEVATTVQGDDRTSMSTPESLVGRDWHSDTTLGSWTRNPEPNPGLVKGPYESQESEGEGMFLGEMYKGVSPAQEISVASQSPRSRYTRDLEEAEEEEACDWALYTEAGEMAKSPIKDESLETNESPSRSRTISQDPEDSGLSTPHCLTPDVALQDCSTETVFQDWAPEVLLAADLLASRSSQSSFKTLSSTSKSTSQDSRTFSSRERSFSKTSSPQEPWTSHIFGPNNQNEEYRSPSQDVQFSRMRPVQAYGSNNHGKKFGDRIKGFILSILAPKGKGQNSLQKAKALSDTTQSRGSIVSRVFMPRHVAEAQDLMTSMRWILEEKLGIHHRFAASKKVLHKDSPRSPTGRQVCHHRIPPTESKTAQGNAGWVHQANPKVHSQPSTGKWIPYAKNQAPVLREPVSHVSHYQYRAQAPLAPGTLVHCPRHCRCNSALPTGKENAFLNIK